MYVTCYSLWGVKNLLNGHKLTVNTENARLAWSLSNEAQQTPSGINWHRSCSLEAAGWDITPEGAASYRWDKFARTSLRAHWRIGRIPKIHADSNILPQETSRCALLPARFNARSQTYRYNLSKGKTGALRPWTVPSLRVSLFLPRDENL